MFKKVEENIMGKGEFAYLHPIIFVNRCLKRGRKHFGKKWKKTLQFQKDNFFFKNVSIICYECIKTKKKINKPEMKILELLPFFLLPVIRANTVTFCTLLFILFLFVRLPICTA